MLHGLLVLGLWAAASSPGHAQLGPETDRPYEMRLVVCFAQDPLLTPLFQDRFLCGLRDGMQGALGNLGRVEAVTCAALQKQRSLAATDPERHELEETLELLGRVEREGLGHALDGGVHLSETKTHFVLVSVENGRYALQARQADGLTGLASPVTRRVTTADRELVVRTALRLVAQDFGVVGTLSAGTAGPEVTMPLRAGALGSFAPWVAKGEVFAVSRIRQAGNDRSATRVPEALVQALEEPRDGSCRCRLLHRYENPLGAGPGVLGYRCVKLATAEAPLEVRLLDGDRPVSGRRVVAQAGDLTGGPPTDTASGLDGTARLGRFRHVALVRVMGPDNFTPVTGEIPVEILPDRPPVVIHVPVDARAEKIGPLESDLRHVMNGLGESLLAVTGLFGELNRTAPDAKGREAALQKARTGLDELRADVARQRREIDRLAAALGASKVEPVRQSLQLLDEKEADLKKYIATLERVIKEEPERARLAELALRAQGLESEAKFDEAIKLYEEVVQGGGKDPSVARYAKHLEELKKEWTPKDDAHAAARKFIYEVWPKLETAAQLQANMNQAREALETLRRVQDRLSVQRFLMANTDHARHLTKRLEELVGRRNPSAQEEQSAIESIRKDLAALTTEAIRLKQGNAEAKPDAR
jgi:hypothetical protein